MKITKCFINDILIIEPKVFEDERGYFYESYNKLKFKEEGLDLDFVQDNQSLSNKGILRGIHFQKEPYSQGKLVRVIKGAVLDVVVDIRKNSKTFGKYYKIELNESNKKMLWIPKGFAHGFLTLENNTIFAYKCTGFYNKNSEFTLKWNDSSVGIDWGINNPELSKKDNEGLMLNQIKESL